MSNGIVPQIRRFPSAATTEQHLVEMATAGLAGMFDPHCGLFCHRLKRTEHGLVQEGISRRYTIITLLGLHRLEENGMASPIPIYPVLERLLADLEWVDNIGDLGLLLWLCALIAPERLDQIERHVKLENGLNRYSDAKQGRTMELAWFLSGLSEWSLTKPQKASELNSLAFQLYWLILNNQGKNGIFRHSSAKGSINGSLRGWIGSFADQVYPILALTKFHKVSQERQAIERALQCARTLCDAQGSFGQWWWHYDSNSGGIVEGYPVFSVHQHGMGPMTLFELGEATGYDFTPWIHNGLRWINADNELAFRMEDESARLIWRGIYRPGLKRYWKAAFSRGTELREYHSSRELRVLFECRPYELGWLLYAFSGRTEAQSRPQVGLDMLA